MSGSLRRRGARILAPLALAAAATVGCLDLGLDPDAPFVIEFDSIPYPALLSGDSMRDSLGVVRPLKVVAYNSDGDPLTGAGTSWFVLDTGATIDVDGILTTTRRDGQVRVVGSVGGLQSPQRMIRIARSPDTLFTIQDTVVTFAYALPDAPGNLTPSMDVRLQTTDTVGGLTPGVHGWILRWRVVHEGDTLAPGDTAIVTLQNGSGSRKGQDTTGTDGTSARRLRIWANRLPASVDSFLVVAEARRYGVQVPGSPLIFKVKVSPAAP